MNQLDEWTATACDALDLAHLTAAQRQAVLDLARDVAHGVMRPAAPLTTFLLGLAVGRGADLPTALAPITRLAEERAGGSAAAHEA